ncbi:hypothetical protein HS041_12380 [Planomonospora sp. ID67723]|uniref:hypothetical protein n=1 Tax=Planomonospora sp. ID67723 TaxID=2738134 RepID=UPI0018C428AB|nr:hypothetical protein [Planomonospora sp. ID67723]MBG0828566.1 hypothetical protein [Planomonospora sp. ID67723]
MARLGRAYPAPARIVGPATHPISASITLAEFETEAEWPALTITTPDARVLLAAFETEAEWPALTLSYEQQFTLSAFETEAEWPALTVTTPILPGENITAAGQIEWNGTLWGAGTDYRVQSVQGWASLPGVNNLNVERPSRHGAWPARKLANQRIVTIRLQLDSITDPTAIDDLIDDFALVTGLDEDGTELPLVIKGYGSPLLAYGAVIDRDLPMEGDYNVGAPTVGLLIACSDPRLYGLTRHGTTVPLDTPTDLSNAGNAATHPIVRIEGPVTNPALTCDTAAGTRTLAFELSLTSSQRLDIDTDAGTADIDGVSSISSLTGSSVPVSEFVLAAGTNTITYSADSGGAEGADFLWRDART